MPIRRLGFRGRRWRGTTAAIVGVAGSVAMWVSVQQRGPGCGRYWPGERAVEIGRVGHALGRRSVSVRGLGSGPQARVRVGFGSRCVRDGLFGRVIGSIFGVCIDIERGYV